MYRFLLIEAFDAAGVEAMAAGIYFVRNDMLAFYESNLPRPSQSDCNFPCSFFARALVILEFVMSPQLFVRQ